jgi:sulfur carrier protein ThiS
LIERIVHVLFQIISLFGICGKIGSLTRLSPQGRITKPSINDGRNWLLRYPHSKTLDRKMTAKLILRKKEYEIRHGMTIRSALKKLEIPPESVLPTREGELISEEEILREGDVIRLVPVISGG